MPPSAPAQPKPRQVPEPSTRPPPQPARKRAIAPGAGEPPGEGRGPGRRASGEPEPADTTQRRREDFEEDPTGEIERPEIMEIDPARFDMTVIKLSRPAKITPKYEFEVFRLYHDVWQGALDVEIGLYRNSKTGDYIIVVGNDQRVYVEKTGPGPKDVEPPIGKGHPQRWKKDILEQGGDKGEWINVAHSHPVDPVTKVVADRGRFPSGADDDFGMLVYESSLLGGADRTAQIWFKTPTGPDYTTFSYRPGAKKRIWIEYPDPNTGRRRRSSSPTSRRTTPGGGTIRPRRRCCDWSRRSRSPRSARAKARNLHPGARRQARPSPHASLGRTSPPKSGILKTCPAGSNAAGVPIPITTSRASTSAT